MPLIYGTLSNVETQMGPARSVCSDRPEHVANGDGAENAAVVVDDPGAMYASRRHLCNGDPEQIRWTDADPGVALGNVLCATSN